MSENKLDDRLTSSKARAALSAALQRARALGFDAAGVTTPEKIGAAGTHLRAFVANGHHGTMHWLETTLARRTDPRMLWPEARSILMLGMNYGPETDPLLTLSQPEKATISVYARGSDYHDVMKGRLKEVAGILAAKSGGNVKVFVDTAPLMEKPLAMSAGLGWQGKHTNLVSRGFGSWLFLGAILTDLSLPASEAERDHCGSCRACLDICPTKAFPAPYRLDARRCISYLTIEHKGPIPHAFRKAIGNRIYGCDDCLAVCPWNKFAKMGREAKLQARPTNKAPDLDALVRLDEAGFRNWFAGSPIKRIGRDRFLRNVLIAIGNSAAPSLLPAVEARLTDASSLVRGAAVWALSQLAPARFDEAKALRYSLETEENVRQEWNQDGIGAQASPPTPATRGS